jgi:hypothetical protein
MATERARAAARAAAFLPLACLLAAGAALAPAPPAVPVLDLQAFLERRALCDHFRGEFPDPPDPVRAHEIEEQLDVQCTGIDEQLEALKRRYRDDPAVSRQLARFETGIDPLPKPR